MFEQFLNELPTNRIVEFVKEYTDDGNLDAIKKINKENLEKINLRNTTLLEYSIQRTEIFKYLVESGADTTVRNKGLTILIQACISGNLDIVKYLIKNDFDIVGDFINERSDNKTPLMFTSEKGHLDIVKYLIKNGANIHATNGSNTALTFASNAGSKNIKVIKYLVKKGVDIKSLSLLCMKSSNFELVKMAVENEICDINQKYHLSISPLYFAATRNNFEIVKYLLNHGATVNNYILKRTNNLEIFKLLCGQPTVVFQYTSKYMHDTININKLFVEIVQNSSLNENDDIEIMKYLLNIGADINKGYYHPDRYRYLTALGEASYNKKLKLVNFLMENGATGIKYPFWSFKEGALTRAKHKNFNEDVIECLEKKLSRQHKWSFSSPKIFLYNKIKVT